MKRYSTTDLRKLEVVNLCDGARLGYAEDFEFEAEGDCTRVLALVIAGRSGFLGFGREDDLVIPWSRVECIGEDTILVRLTPPEFSACLCGRKVHGRFGSDRRKC